MQKKTDAYLKIEAKREAFTSGKRDLVKVQCKNLSSTVYLYTNTTGLPCAIGYKGRAVKPTIHYCFKTDEQRQLKVKSWMEHLSEHAKKVSIKQGRELNVGDVLYASWGYDQTNLDFYKCLRLVGKTSVELIEIGQERSYDSSMSGKAIPLPDVEVGQPFVRRVSGITVRINDCYSASRDEPKEIVKGVKVYAGRYWSSYA